MTYGPTEAERKSLVFRRSLYIAKDMRAGEVLTSENLRVVRPGMGLHPRYYEDLLGRKVRQDLKMGTAVSWDLIA
ncbi:SAF domain-containing protein [Achromobacter xylosoxidans]